MAYMRRRREERKKVGWSLLRIVGALLFFFAVIYGESNRQGESNRPPETIFWQEENWWRNELIPLAGFLEEGRTDRSFRELFFSLFFCSSPLYEYAIDGMESEENRVLAYTYEMVLLKEGSDEEYEQLMLSQMEEENQMLWEENELTQESVPEEAPSAAVLSENAEAASEDGIPLPTEKSISYNRADLQNFDYLVENFYIVDAGTTITEARLMPQQLLDMDMRMEDRGEEGPQILIYHTHSQEGYADSVPGDSSTTIVGVGEHLAEILRRDYGYEVLHHTGEYDVEQRDYAYSNAEPEITRILQENPSIQVVIDLHRDEVSADRRLVTEVAGRPMAQFMLFNGLSYVNDLGSIDYLFNPNLSANLAFSLQMQVAAEEYYPGLTRRIYLKGYRYNMHLMDKYLLIELGAQTNTVEEAMNTCYPIAHLLDMVLQGENPH